MAVWCRNNGPQVEEYCKTCCTAHPIVAEGIEERGVELVFFFFFFFFSENFDNDRCAADDINLQRTASVSISICAILLIKYRHFNWWNRYVDDLFDLINVWNDVDQVGFSNKWGGELDHIRHLCRPLFFSWRSVYDHARFGNLDIGG